MIKVFDKKEDCCGCTACKSICPTQSIVMNPDEEGFLYPQINQELCIDCGLCQEVCPLQNEVNVSNKFTEPLVYALKHKSDKVRMSSASGGAYTAISDYALNSQYIIYGVQFNNDFTVCHSGATTVNRRDRFKGSKYIQSNLGEVFIKVKEELRKDKKVLFTGTACQVAGLRKYLEVSKVKTNNLILNDLICHGVSSPLLWKEYLEFIQNKSKLKSYTFRYKAKGWHGYNVKAEFEDGTSKINNFDIMIYANLYSSNLALRPSCYYCRYSNLQRPSDIMIGDFWGIERTLPEFDDGIGVSLVFVNTPKGKELFNNISDKIEFLPSNIKECLQYNLQKPTKIPTNRDQFWDNYHRYGFIYIAKKYGGYSIKGRLKRIIITFLKKFGLFGLTKKILEKTNKMDN